MRRLASLLVAVTIVGYGIAAMTAIGVLDPALWTPAIALGSVASVALLAASFHPWLVLGLVIDVVLLWSTLVAHWHPGMVGWGV
jgi:hypothetical protein